MHRFFEHTAQSNVGLVRSNNQDSGYAGSYLAAVADGMGGHAGGDIASAKIITEITNFNSNSSQKNKIDSFINTIEKANISLAEIVKSEPKLAGLGTTLTVALLEEETIHIAHIGDSRAYLFRDNNLTQITHDHTFVQHLVDENKITAEEAENHPQRSVLMRVLGDVDSNTQLDVNSYETKVDDIWVLCSDGLTAVVSNDTINQTLQEENNLDLVSQKLVDLALKGGAPDNVTIVLVRLKETIFAPIDINEIFVGSINLPEIQETLKPYNLSKEDISEDSVNFTADNIFLEQKNIDADNNYKEIEHFSTVYGNEKNVNRQSDKKVFKKISLILLAAILLLTIVGIFSYRWAQQQYFVGVKNSNIAIFQGIPQNFGPIKLSSVYETQTIRLDSLPEYARERVKQTIVASDIKDAKNIVKNLNNISKNFMCSEPENSSDPNCKIGY